MNVKTHNIIIIHCNNMMAVSSLHFKPYSYGCHSPADLKIKFIYTELHAVYNTVAIP